MKILLIRTSSAENTVFKNIYNEQEVGLAKELVKKGHECGIVYYAKKGNASIQEIKVEDKTIKIYNIEGKEFIKSAIYNEEIYELCDQYDILQIYECDKIMSWKIYSKFPNKTLLYHGPYKAKFTWKHNIYTNLFYKLFLKRNKYYKAPIITKSVLAEKYLKKIGFKNVETIGVGLDTNKLENNLNKENNFVKSLKEKNSNDINLLYIGKLEKRRNIKFLIKLFAELKKANGNINLIIVGKGDKNYVVKLFNYAKKIGVYDNIKYCESIPQNETKQLYEFADLFLLPTKYEIFGMVLLEAMYCKLPVVTTLNGGSSVLIQNGKNGFVCKENDVVEWKNIIYQYVINKTTYKEIGNNAKSTIIDKFVWEKLSNKFEKKYLLLNK